MRTKTKLFISDKYKDIHQKVNMIEHFTYKTYTIKLVTEYSCMLRIQCKGNVEMSITAMKDALQYVLEEICKNIGISSDCFTISHARKWKYGNSIKFKLSVTGKELNQYIQNDIAEQLKNPLTSPINKFIRDKLDVV